MSKSFSIVLIRIAYFLFGLLVIIGGNLNLPFLVYVFKPLLMPTLILFVLFSAKLQAVRKFIIIAALFFALLGDVALIFDHQFFVFGLASFLITHIFYCIVFSLPDSCIGQLTLAKTGEEHGYNYFFRLRSFKSRI